MNAVQPSALIVSPFGERGDHSCFYCQVPTRRPKLPVVGRVHDHAFVPAGSGSAFRTLTFANWLAPAPSCCVLISAASKRGVAGGLSHGYSASLC